MNMTMGSSGGFNNLGSSQEQKASSEEKNQTIIPLVIEQIMNLEDPPKFWGLDINIITTVGVVQNIEHSSTKITYTIEDHTARIDCYLWLEEGDSAEVSNIMLNTYVKVVGNIRKNQGNKSVMIFNIDPVKSFNEITTHLLEVLQARYQAEKWHNDGVNDSTKAHSDLGPMSLGTSSMSGMMANSMSPQQEMVYNVIRSYPYPEGISTKLLLEKFPALNTNELNKVTDYLCNEGHIYTTIDAEHFLSTDI